MSLTQHPLVSVIIPAYNAEQTIASTINSVLNQTYTNLEIIIVNDGSQDSTADLIAQFAAKDKRIILIQQENAGVAKARNLAIEESRGEYIAPIDADDIWFPQKIEKQLQYMLDSSLSVGLVYGWSVYVNARDEIFGEYKADIYQTMHSIEGYVLPALAYSNFLNNASIPLIRRCCFISVGGYDYQLRAQNAQGCEDLDLYWRIAEEYEFRVVPEFIMGYRQSYGTMSQNSMIMEKSYHLVMAKLRSCHQEIPSHFFRWSKSYFYNYLIGRTYSYGNYQDAIYWVYKALTTDWAIALRPGIYKVALLSGVRIIIQPVASLILRNHQALAEFQARFFATRNKYDSLTEIKQKWHQSHSYPGWLYERVLRYRWHQVKKICQTDLDLLRSKHRQNTT